jgi:hypothetical protein
MRNIPLRYIQRILRVAGSFNPAIEMDGHKLRLWFPPLLRYAPRCHQLHIGNHYTSCLKYIRPFVSILDI